MSGNTTFKLNGSQMVRTIRRLAREHPERRSRCRYMIANHTKPECIVGHAMAEQIGTIGLRKLDNLTFGSLRYDEIQLRSDRYAEWITEVQRAQDAGVTWKQAVTAADAQHGKVW